MRRVLVLAVSALVAVGSLVVAVAASAQSNDNDYTPMNSRIRCDRQFPFEPPPNFVPPAKMDKVERQRTRSMESEFSYCLYHRSPSGALDFLDKTDFGFVNFSQIGMDPDKAMGIYGFHDCLNRVAERNVSGVGLRFYAPNLRQWLLQAAYFDRYPHGPTWLKPGYVMAPRTYPLSANVPAVHAFMDFADCVVTSDPYDADLFYRTAAGSDAEKQAVASLTPSLGPCLPQGVQLHLQPDELRHWLGEALWQAASHSVPAPAEPAAAAR